MIKYLLILSIILIIGCSPTYETEYNIVKSQLDQQSKEISYMNDRFDEMNKTISDKDIEIKQLKEDNLKSKEYYEVCRFIG